MCDIDECLTNNGNCGDSTYFTCTNNLGSLPTCNDINECSTNNGNCGDSTYFTCTNNIGSLPTCNDIDECLTNNGNCGDSTYFTCENNIGSSPTCNDIDECSINNGNCGDSTYFTCTNNIGGLPTCNDIDECLTNNGNCGDSTYFTCENNVGELPTCTDIDECLTNNGNCGDSTYFTCTNNIGSLPTCNDIDECLTNNGNCGDSTYFTCINNIGNSPTCNDINECLTNTHNCNTNAYCTNTIGSFTCTCNSGYEGNGIICNDTDECLNPATCQTGYVCENTVGSYNCNEFCGNNVVTSSEECEATDLVGETCISLGYSAGALTCENTCQYKTSDCRITKQWGTTSYDYGISVTVDSSGNVFVTGDTNGGLDGNTSAGLSDIFLTKFSNSGVKQWTKQWGTYLQDQGNSVAVDSSDNVFVIGFTGSGLDGNTNTGSDDIFLTKWNNAGVKQWTKQWGTTSYDNAYWVAIDISGNVFVTGYTQGGLDGNTNLGSTDLFLTKFDNIGVKQWTKQWGTTSSDIGFSVAVDSSGNVFITGYTAGGLDGNTNAGSDDIFLTKFDNNGVKQWTKQWGITESDYGKSVTVDSLGNVFVTGSTSGGLDGNTNAGLRDIFLTKFDNAGVKQWTKQWGTTLNDSGKSVSIDNSGNVFVTGSTEYGLDGNTNSGSTDIFLTKFDNAGTKIWTKQWGTVWDDSGLSVSVDILGKVFVTGYTYSGMDGNTNSNLNCDGTTSNCQDIFLTIFEAQ